MAQSGGTRIDPRFIELAGGNSSRASTGMGGTNWAAAAAQMQADQANKDWDPVLRPIEQIFNTISAGGSAVRNAIDKGVKGGIEGGPLGAIGGGVGGLVNGFFASWNNDPKSENYMTGSKLLESVTDRFGNAYDPDYVDREDNVDPVTKASLGFVADVALDPITYVPGGVFASAARGAYRAAKTAEGLAKVPAAVKGVVEGVPDAYKLGKITNTVKPIGLKQWGEVRDMEKFAKLQRKTGLSQELMFTLTTANGARRFMDEILPKLRETNGPDYLPNMTEDYVQELSAKLQQLAPNYEKTMTGADAARAVAKNEAPATGASGYIYGDTPPVVSRKSAREIADATRARMDDNKALSDLEIQKLDAQNVLAAAQKQLPVLTAERAKVQKLLDEADRRAQTADVKAQSIEADAALAEQAAQLDEAIRVTRNEIARHTYRLSGLQDQFTEIATRNGADVTLPDEGQSFAATVDKAINYIAIKGIDESGIVGFNTPVHRALYAIDQTVGVSEGSTQVLLASLETALRSGAIEDVPMGIVGGKQLMLNDLINHFYGAGSENVTDLTSDQIEFFSAVISHTLDRMWEISHKTFSIATDMAVTERTAGNFKDVVKGAVARASQTVIENNREIITRAEGRLAELGELSIEDRTLHATEIHRWTQMSKAAEDSIRLIENGGPEGLAAYVVAGGFDAANEAGKISGLLSLETGRDVVQEANLMMTRVGFVRRAIAQIDATDMPTEARNNEIVTRLAELIETHSAAKESLAAIAAITGDSKTTIKSLLEILVGVHNPMEAGISNPELFGKLIIEVAKLPIEIPGISDVARLRARAFAEAETMGVYGLETGMTERGTLAYGNELLRNFQDAGGVVLEETGQSGRNVDQILAGNEDALNDLVERQAVDQSLAGEVYDPRGGQVGFGMGVPTSATRGEGPLGALDLFGNLVARGIDKADLERNLENYRAATYLQIAQQYTDALESAIVGRKPYFRGEPIQEFIEYWDSEFARFTETPASANIFNTPADAAIRGTKAAPLKAAHRMRTPANDVVMRKTYSKDNKTVTEEVAKEDSLGTLLGLPDGPAPKNMTFNEGAGTPLPLASGRGAAQIDVEFQRVFPGHTAEIPVSQHVLGYAKKPLEMMDWLRTISLAAKSKAISGNFFGRYRAVAERLNIPYVYSDAEDFVQPLAELASNPQVTAAYKNYRASFDGAVAAEKTATTDARIAEVNKASGKDTGYTKQEFKELREAGSFNYGVDPLGRVFRIGKEQGAGGAVTDRRLDPYSWLEAAGKQIDTTKLKSIILSAKTPEKAIGAIERAYPHHASIITQAVIHTWGKIGKFGYTPESAKAIIDMRSAIAGSVTGIKNALDEAVSNVTITREYAKPLAQAIDEAQRSLEYERLLTPANFKPASDVLQPRVKFRDIVNRDVIGEMANQETPFGSIIRNFNIHWEKDPATDTWLAKGPKQVKKLDDPIVGGDYGLKEEVRDWVTGGVKEVSIKDPDTVAGTYTSFDDLVAIEMLQRTGLPNDLAKQVAFDMAVKASSLVDKKTGALRVSPQEYANLLVGAAVKRLDEADKISAQRLRPTKAKPRRNKVSEDELFTDPKHIALLRRVLEIAPFHAKPIDVNGNVIGLSKYEAQKIAGTTKPVRSLSDLVARIDSIKAKHFGAPNSGMIQKLNGAEEVVRLLQIDEAGHSNLIAGAVSSKNVDSYFSLEEKRIIDATVPADSHMVSGGDEIIARAAELDVMEYSTIFGRNVDAKKAMAGKSPIATALDAKMRGTIRDSIVNAVKAAHANKGYRVFGADVDRKALHGVLQEVDRAGRALNLSGQEIAALKRYTMAIAREETDKLGLVPVTSLAGNNVGRVKYSINSDVDWAYIGYTDVIDALYATDAGVTGARLLSEIMPETGKALRGIETGLIFPPNVIAEMGVLSMKFAESGLSQSDTATAIYYALIESVRSTPKGLFNGILDGVDAVRPLGEHAARLAEIAQALSKPEVANVLRETHLANGALHRARAGEVARQISEPVLARILNARTNPGSTLDDVVKAIAGSSAEVRRRAADAGVASDSLEAAIAKGEVQKAVNETFTPTEVGITRTTVRMGRAAQDAAKISDPVKRQAAIRAATSEEAANLARQRIKLANEIASRDTAVLIRELVSEPTPENMAAAYEAALSQLESSMVGSMNLQKAFAGGPEYLAMVATAKEAAEALQREKDAIINGITATEFKRQQAKDNLAQLRKTRAAVRKAQNNAEKASIVSTKTSTTAAAAKKRARLDEIDAEIAKLEQIINEVTPEANFYDTSKLASDIARQELSSSADISRGSQAAQAFSFRSYAPDMVHLASRGQTAADNNINNFEALAERLQMRLNRLFGVIATRVPKAGFEGEDLMRSQAALEFGNTLLRRFFVDGEKFDDVLKSLKNADEREAATELHELMSYILDPSGNIFIRAGLDADWLNKFIARGPLGDTKAAQFLKGLNGNHGEALAENLRRNVDELLKAPTGKGGADWLTIAKGYSWAFQRAAEVPTLAAEFSARFGHKAQGLSSEQALEMGYRAISRNGTLAQWLDPNQVYPPEYLRQLANMQKYLDQIDSVNIKDEGFGRFIRATDKVTGVLKSSITLWRPGHHVVNGMGEYFMNLLAGVINPVRYAQSWRVMKSVGEFDSGKVFGHNYDIPLDNFMNSYKMDAFTGANGNEGIRTMVNGKEYVIPHAEFYRMLEQKGLLLNNNTAEDIIVQGDNLMGSRNRAGGLIGDLRRANEGLGAFSARRDNVFRIAHAIDIAMKKPHRSVAAMIDDISINVQEYHPTMQMLSPFERKYMRRIAYFYTWQRNAMSVIARTLLEDPRLFMLAPYANYEASVAMGGDPQSIGQPMPNDPRLAGFAAANVLGPHWYNEAGNIEGFTLNAPQIDVLSTVMGNLYYDPSQDPLANAAQNGMTLLRENTLGQVNPVWGAPLDIMYNAQYTGGEGGRAVNDWGDYLIDKTGLGYVSRITGTGLINNQGFLGPRSDQKTEEERGRAGINALTGLRFTEWSKWYETAQRERNARLKVQQDELARKLGIMP